MGPIHLNYFSAFCGRKDKNHIHVPADNYSTVKYCIYIKCTEYAESMKCCVNTFVSMQVSCAYIKQFILNNKYRISRPIRRTVIFSLEILEKKMMMNVF